MPNNQFKSHIVKKYSHNHARVTSVSTPHGEFLTPAFMPVGTRAGVNCMLPSDLVATDSQIILGGNTYHMLCAPGMEVIEQAGGMHTFMAWPGPMLTDSGGFQVFSLSKQSEICQIDEDGAHFKHPDTQKIIHLTPETSIATQKIIGADIIMAFDQCTPDTEDRTLILQAMERTHRWLAQSKEYHERSPNSAYGSRQALFGIIQGSSVKELRQQSTEFVVSLDFDGIAIGGETIGFNMPKTVEIIDWVRPLLPENKTRYTMGVGATPQDLFDVVAQGIDIFDCVAPTRNARHGALYAGEIVREGHWFAFKSDYEGGRLSLKKACFAHDERPLMSTCECFTCQNYSRAYLHHLLKCKAISYSSLACIHNIHVMNKACAVMRKEILESNGMCSDNHAPVKKDFKYSNF